MNTFPKIEAMLIMKKRSDTKSARVEYLIAFLCQTNPDICKQHEFGRNFWHAPTACIIIPSAIRIIMNAIISPCVWTLNIFMVVLEGARSENL